MCDAYIEPEGCEFFCEDCAPEGAEGYPDGGGEADTPQHCSGCHCPLDNPLTEYGVQYVVEAVKESLAAGNYTMMCGTPYKGGWFEGSRHCEIVRGWAEQVQNYNLSDADADTVEKFLEVSEK
ncbi:MAG: hypothetical protein ABGY10_03870 [bacterium]